MSPEYVEQDDVNESTQAPPPFRMITPEDLADDAGYCADGVCVVPEPDLGPRAQ